MIIWCKIHVIINPLVKGICVVIFSIRGIILSYQIWLCFNWLLLNRNPIKSFLKSNLTRTIILCCQWLNVHVISTQRLMRHKKTRFNDIQGKLSWGNNKSFSRIYVHCEITVIYWVLSVKILCEHNLFVSPFCR